MMVRDLEKKVLMITPDSIMMEGETVLTQYIILSWKLDYMNQSMLFYIYIYVYIMTGQSWTFLPRWDFRNQPINVKRSKSFMICEEKGDLKDCFKAEIATVNCSWNTSLLKKKKIKFYNSKQIVYIENCLQKYIRHKKRISSWIFYFFIIFL